MTFSEKMLLLRKKKGLSQEQLAEMLDVSQQTISDWESQQSLPELSKIIVLSDILGISIDQLIKDDQRLFGDEDSSELEEVSMEIVNAAPSEVQLEVMFCTRCGKKNQADSSFCGYCGNPFTSFVANTSETSKIKKAELDLAYYKANLEMQQQALLLKQEELAEMRRQTKRQQEQIELQRKQYDKMMKCPRCGSTSLSGNKKGYGIGKGVIGAAVFGPLGLIAGNLGAGDVVVTCMKCGHKFKK